VLAAAMRIELSDPSRLGELSDYFQSVHAHARIEDDALLVELSGAPTDADARHLRSYLGTWLALSAARNKPVTAQVHDE
jgi:hypothetical protein